MEFLDTPLMLGVSGMRGIVDQSLTWAVVARYATAFSQWLQSSGFQSATPHVIIGRDSRPSGARFEQAACAGLTATGCQVTVLGIASTPGVAVMIRKLSADGALVITASHNPTAWNGVKLIRHVGAAPSADQVAAIIARFHHVEAPSDDLAAPASMTLDRSVPQVHRDEILAGLDVDAIRGAGLKVVVDSVCGAGGPETMALLDALGVKLIHLYAEPTGAFPHTPEPLRENLTELSDAVAAHGADIGFAQDPDADRLALVDETGAYLGEEYTLALCGLHKLKRGDIAVANLSTSRMIDDVAIRAQAQVVRTAVGEANVAAAMMQSGAVIGGEGNGGIILPSVSHVRDSFAGMGLLLEMLAHRRKTLSAIAKQLPRYAIVKEKLPIDARWAEELGSVMRKTFAGQEIDEQDGVRVDQADRWVHVRMSNTEPIVRVIAEAPQEAEAVALVEQCKRAMSCER